MGWLPLKRFRDPAVPKLNNLRRAAAAGLHVPPTWWLPASSVLAEVPPPPAGVGTGPLIVRSGSPTEDGHVTSNAGQLLSLIVRERGAFSAAVRRVAEALPPDAQGKPRGAVFVQPLVESEEAGVVFFDGFYYERARAAGGNQELTAGRVRGEVTRGHMARGEAWSQWLEAVYAVFGEDAGGDRNLDLEYARDAGGYVLLQVRPALFPVRRNHTLTMTNHKETFGDLPSPWTVYSFVEAGKELRFLKRVQPAFRRWQECHAVDVAERPWLNLSYILRWADYLGVPRARLMRALGGLPTTPADGRPNWGRLLRRLPHWSVPFVLGIHQVARTKRLLREADARIEAARDLRGLYQASVAGWQVGIDCAIAIAGLALLSLLIRQALRLPGSARVVTREMMDDYGRLAALPAGPLREAGLDAWLVKYGHRAPWESDLARPRFAELRGVLLQDLNHASPPADPAPPPCLIRRSLHRLSRPFFWIDEWREWFRNTACHGWQRLRARLLEEGARLVAAGELDAAKDVFWLRGNELDGPAPLREAVRAAKARHERAREIEFPLTASQDEIEQLLTRAESVSDKASGRRLFPGIALSPAIVEGRALRADDLLALLREAGTNGSLLGPETILVVPSLEPAWAVVFPRVAGVAADLGGELSHASILLREARKPAVVNCTGLFREVRTGDRLRLDGARGLVELLDVPGRFDSGPGAE
jgi:pyruvate,water dikinase